MPTTSAIWARVSTKDQETANQLGQQRRLARDRELNVTAEFVTEDSAWQSGNGKGAEFDRKRAELINGARLGNYRVVIVWAIDRLSRRGIEDTLATLRQLYDAGCDVWSIQEPWIITTEPRMRELLVSMFAWMAEQESARRSERTKAGLKRRKERDGLPIGRQEGARDKTKRNRSGYVSAWEGEAGKARKAALAERNRQRAAQRRQERP